jgi:hypothetical protein
VRGEVERTLVLVSSSFATRGEVVIAAAARGGVRERRAPAPERARVRQPSPSRARATGTSAGRRRPARDGGIWAASGEKRGLGEATAAALRRREAGD